MNKLLKEEKFVGLTQGWEIFEFWPGTAEIHW